MYRIVLAQFPYTESLTKKKRPVLLLTETPYGKYQIVVVAYISSKKGEGIESEIIIKKSKTNGLRKDSIIKLHKLAHLPIFVITEEMGSLNRREDLEVKKKLVRLFQL